MGVRPRPLALHPPPFHPRSPQQSVGRLFSPAGASNLPHQPPLYSEEVRSFLARRPSILLPFTPALFKRSWGVRSRPPAPPTSHSHPCAPQKSVGPHHHLRSSTPALLKRAWVVRHRPPAPLSTSHPPPRSSKERGVRPRPPAPPPPADPHPPPSHPRPPQKRVGRLSSPAGPPSTSHPPPRS